MLRTGLIVAALVAFPAAASAQDGGSQALLECREIGSDKDRLRCYDEALDAQYGVSEELKEKRAQYRRDRFGLPVDDAGMRMTELEAVVSEVDEDLRTGMITFGLDNGQVWRLTSNGGLRARIKRGMTVIISESRMGGYRVRIPEKTGFKGVIRVR